MSLSSIISGVINKESKVDRKKLAYFFKDLSQNKSKVFSLGLLLRILSPTDITILETQETFVDNENNIVKRIQEMTAVLFPKVPVTVIHGYHDDNGNIIENGEVLNKEKLMTADVGLFIDCGGNLSVYRGTGVPDDAAFYVPNLDQEGLEMLRDADLDILLPTKNMFMVTDLVRTREPEIKICYFMTNNKMVNVNKIAEITKTLLTANPRTAIQTHYFEDDWKDWNDGKDQVNPFSSQSDYVLAIRGDRIHVHLESEDGHLPKEPNGWLLLN